MNYPNIIYEENSFKAKETNKTITDFITSDIGIDIIDYKVEDNYDCIVDVDYELIYRMENLLGINFSYRVHSLGAGNMRIGNAFLNLNLKNSSYFEFKDVFTSKGLDEIKNMIVKKAENDEIDFQGGDCTVSEIERVAEAVDKDPDFYFNTNGDFVVNFDQHSIEAGACANGIVKFPIDAIKGLLNRNGPLAFAI